MVSDSTHSSDFWSQQEAPKSRLWPLTIGCIGVVYGDIGTSPLYAFRAAVSHVAQDGHIQPGEVLGILSLIMWSLMVIVTLKYVLFLLRADNKGEGGILSLMALAQKSIGKRAGVIFFLGAIGAALFYSDAAITPAISVLSAVEGFKLVIPDFDKFVMPVSVVIMFALFYVQKFGTHSVSRFFGPIMVVWFLSLGAAGLHWIIQNPVILSSFNPFHAIAFLLSHTSISLVVLGSVFLAITGAETLYTDLGHFGRKPIQLAWIFLVFPCLALNYLGQGALVLADETAIADSFFRLVPQWCLIPMLILATCATIIASQAVITGAYSLTRQAIQLGFFPRFEIRHTSESEEGQIFIPKTNTLLFYAVIFLILIFGTSAALASAYGIAVCGTMAVTSCMVFCVVWKRWKKSFWFSLLLVLPFFGIELVFLSANFLKVFDGGFFPLILATLLVVLMGIWVRGSRYLYKKAHRQAVPLTDLLETLERKPLATAPGTAVFLTSDPFDAPVALLQNLKHNKVLHDKNIIFTIQTTHAPKIRDDQRLTVQVISSRMTRIVANFGYMETPDVPKALLQARSLGVNVDIETVSYFLGRRTIVSDPKRGLPEWQDRIYIALARSAVAATDFYRIPPNQAVELGLQMTV